MLLSYIKNNIIDLFILIIGATSLFLISKQNYLLFHSLAELFGIFIGLGIFIISWNSKSTTINGYVSFLGIAYLFISIFDLIHTLSYSGMGVFNFNGANQATQLWIVARYFESFSLLVAPIFLNKTINRRPLISVFFIFSTIPLLMIFTFENFPNCFVENEGLSAFKKRSEYVIAIIFFFAALFLYKKKDKLNSHDFKLIFYSIGISIIAELAFTLYISVYGLFNFLGHMLKVLSFYLVYKAIIQTSLINPFNLLYCQLKENEIKLSNEKIQLKSALEEIKKLQGMIPICSYCKKIRDDDGFWQQVGDYIHNHTEANVTHGVCPDCLKKYFPDIST